MNSQEAVARVIEKLEARRKGSGNTSKCHCTSFWRQLGRIPAGVHDDLYTLGPQRHTAVKKVKEEFDYELRMRVVLQVGTVVFLIRGAFRNVTSC